MEEIKQRISAKAYKIKRYTNRIKKFQHKKLFQNNQKQFYSELSEKEVTNEQPDPTEVTNFWSRIWGERAQHNDNAEWIRKVKDELKGKQQQELISVMMNE